MSGRRVLVIGGGAVAEDKVKGLLAADADVTIISPELTPELETLRANGSVRWQQRQYVEGDLVGYEVCMIATDDGAVNAAVAAEGKRARIWVNAADDPANCDFILPSVVRQGSIVVAASTGGGSPALARRLREELTDFLGEDYAPLGELLASVRAELRQKQVRVSAEVWQAAIDARFRALVAQRRIDEARDYLLRNLGVSEAIAMAPG
jgi:precorrin-2 dehydrogenase / sirohydrochlorin ferrochelatase